MSDDIEMTQQEICSELKIDPHRIKRMREEHLTTDDFFTRKNPRGGRPTVIYTKTGIEKLIIIQSGKRLAPLAMPKFARAKVIGPAQNPKYVWCKVKDGEKMVKAAVLVPNKYRKFVPPGATFKVQVVEDEDGERSYRHEKLCP